MESKTNLYLIFSIFIIFLSFFLLFLLIDAKAMDHQIFQDLSVAFDTIITNLFGNFSFLFISTGIFSGLTLLLPTKTNTKMFSVAGYLLLVLLIPPFYESFALAKSTTGIYGINLSKIFIQMGLGGAFFLYFFWFFLSIFLLAYPLKEEIAKKIVQAFLSTKNNSQSKIVKSNAPTQRRLPNSIKEIKQAPARNHNTNRNKNFPWVSKIIYEDSNRIEIPLMPNSNDKIMKFKLLKRNEILDEYEQISLDQAGYPNEVYKNIAENEGQYYERLKSAWPENWKKDKEENEVLTKENISDNLNDKIINYEKKIEPGIPENKDEKIDLITPVYENNINLEEKNIAEPEVNNNVLKDNAEKENYPDINFNENNYLPEMDILESSNKINKSKFMGEHNESAAILEETLQEFGIKAEVCEIIHGPVVTLFKLIPAPGIKLQKIESLSNNLALRLAAQSIRIIAPIPGEKVVGIEIPNRNRELIRFKDIVNSKVFTQSSHHLPIGLGKDIYGNTIVVDLYKMPHILIAGATGAGKSVCVNSIISSILFSKTPDEVRLLFIDPKIVELKPYNNIPHLLTPVITDSKKAVIALKYLLFEMERRYELLDQIGARDIVEYQKRRAKRKHSLPEELPFIVAIIDEFADLLSTSGKEAEILFARLAAKARAVGIHLVLATQRPSTDVITGLIKANIPARIAFQVIALQDSRIILDQKGAEKLLGQGDMLYLSPTQPFPIRLQGAFLTKEEVDLIAEHWKSIAPPKFINIEEILFDAAEEEKEFERDENSDPLFKQAIDIVYQSQKASASYLQRRLGIGYNRAARMIEEMEEMGIVGPQRGAKPREIIGSLSDF